MTIELPDPGLAHCKTCKHLAKKDGGWCYMWKERPAYLCVKPHYEPIEPIMIPNDPSAGKSTLPEALTKPPAITLTLTLPPAAPYPFPPKPSSNLSFSIGSGSGGKISQEKRQQAKEAKRLKKLRRKQGRK